MSPNPKVRAFPPRTRVPHFLAPEPAEPSTGPMPRMEMPA